MIDEEYIAQIKKKGSGLYILDENGDPKEEPDALAWARWFESNTEQRRVALTKIGGITEVSTVFLGVDHSYTKEGPPVLYETMVFGCGQLDGYQERYCTRQEALEGHEYVVLKVKGNNP